MAEASKKKLSPEDIENLPEVTPHHKGITDEEILDLKLKGFSHQRIGDILGCGKSNITQRLGKYRTELEGLEGFKKNRADIFALHQIRALAQVTNEKLKEASLRDIVIATGVLYDKERQERGQSENKNSISIILNLAHEANEKKIIDVKATVEK